MVPLKIATAQFENRSGDTAYNLSIIDSLAKKAANEGSQVIAFHECSLTGYGFARHLNKEQLLDISEFIPDGESIQQLIAISSKYNIAILAGLFEKDSDNYIYKAYVCVTKDGLVAKFRKLHPFINPHILPGNSYCVFELFRNH